MRSVATIDGHDVGLADRAKLEGRSETFMDQLEAFLEREMRGSMA